MSENERELKECNRCKWRWFSKVEDVKRCPNCKSQYWNTPRVRKIAKERKALAYG